MSDKLILALARGKERYVWCFHDTEADRQELLRVIGRAASNPELSLNWYDAAVLSHKIRAGLAVYRRERKGRR